MSAMTRKTHQRTSTKRRHQATCLASTTAVLNASVHPHDVPREHPAQDRGATAADAGWIRSSQRMLVMRGLSPTEASNVVAWVAGLHATEGGWSVHEIEQLVALRSFTACGVIAP